jgi:hypothetical protein
LCGEQLASAIDGGLIHVSALSNVDAPCSAAGAAPTTAPSTTASDILREGGRNHSHRSEKNGGDD